MLLKRCQNSAASHRAVLQEGTFAGLHMSGLSAKPVASLGGGGGGLPQVTPYRG